MSISAVRPSGAGSAGSSMWSTTSSAHGTVRLSPSRSRVTPASVAWSRVPGNASPETAYATSVFSRGGRCRAGSSQAPRSGRSVSMRRTSSNFRRSAGMSGGFTSSPSASAPTSTPRTSSSPRSTTRRPTARSGNAGGGASEAKRTSRTPSRGSAALPSSESASAVHPANVPSKAAPFTGTTRTAPVPAGAARAAVTGSSPMGASPIGASPRTTTSPVALRRACARRRGGCIGRILGTSGGTVKAALSPRILALGPRCRHESAGTTRRASQGRPRQGPRRRSGSPGGAIASPADGGYVWPPRP